MLSDPVYLTYTDKSFCHKNISMWVVLILVCW